MSQLFKSKKMFRKIRRKEKQLFLEECHRILTKAEYGTLATMGEEGYPYAVSVNYVFLNGNIYFHCANDGHKLDNIAFCPNVSFNVVTDVWVEPLISDEKDHETESIFNGFDTHFSSVVVFGEAKEVNDTEKRDGLQALLRKFLNLKNLCQYEDEGIKYIDNSLNRTKLIKIEIKHMSGKRGIRENIQIQGK
jgi:nitroimidazol reductase NimA-like FMN-containing flavoprotein (pyridoxamine 5'-phosphate oxidase superfamily)